MGKSIKKISKIVLIFLLVTAAIPTILYFVLKNHNVQTYLTHKIVKQVSENLNAKFEIESVNYRFFNKIVLKKVYIEDQLKDTLLYSDELICYIKKLDRKKQLIEISTIKLVDAKFYLHKFDTLQSMNLVFLTKSLAKKEKTAKDSANWQVVFRNIKLENTVFWYKSVRKREKDFGVNFNDLVCYIDDLDIRNLKVENGEVQFFTKKLIFREKSGFSVLRMNFGMHISPKFMKFKDVVIRTPYSFINADSLIFKHKDFDVYKEFAKNIYLDFNLQESNLSLIDLGYFVPIFKDINLNAGISGRAYNRLSNFKGKDIKIQIGKQTELITDFDLNGLPDYNQMFIYADFKKLNTWASDLEIINKFLKSGKKVVIPESFEKMGIISYNGVFSGFFDDFVTYGKFTSDLGKVVTDLSLKPDTSQTLAFSGNLKTMNFKVGELFPGTNRIGEISANAQIKGSVNNNKKLKATTRGTIQNIQINNYNYQNILIDGYLTNKTYDGFLSISDPNIDLSFSGGIDFSTEIPKFNFNASVPNANLYGLNIDKKDTTSNISFHVNAKFEGIDLDDAVGKIIFTDSKLKKYNETLEVDTLRVIAEHFISDTNKLLLQSDYIDASIIGDYKSSTLIQSIKNLYFNYAPALINHPTDTISLDYNNNFSLNLSLKNTALISKFFFPSLYLSDSTWLKFDYNANRKVFILKAQTKQAKFKEHTFNGLNVQTFSNDTLFTIITKSSSLILNNFFTLTDFKTTSIIHKNNIDLKIDWDNHKKNIYKGKILASTNFKQIKSFDAPSTQITILPSEIVVNDSVWHIDKSIINIDSTSYKVRNFLISHGEQYFSINGQISENPSDTLFVETGKINLAHLNILTKKSNLHFKGFIDGTANISDFYNSRLFFADLSINNLELNNESFGKTRINSTWLKEKNAIQLEAKTFYNNKSTIHFTGEYYPEIKNIDGAIIIDSLGLQVINPYLKSFASNVQGFGSGDVKINGTLKNPQFNGILLLENAGMTIDYINSRYFFNSIAKVENNSLIFTNVETYDIYNNKAITNGRVNFNHGISFNFGIDANNVLALNTKSIQNETFYGTAFATGLINVVGANHNTNLNISARTEPNTKINIPLERKQTKENVGFVSFVNSTSDNEEAKDETIDFSGFTLNFDLEITPDAEAQLIFDSKIGDVIRGNGEGNIKMSIDEKNDFKMYGDFTIEDGDYLFTLQNVINKRFKIKQGGNILWNGEPYDADIDIEAVYSLKTSLNTLVDSSYATYTNTDYKKRIPVDCQVFLTNKLMNPNISFNIDLPTADEESKTLVRSIINTEEKLNKQFLSLLVLNAFMKEQEGTENFYSGTSTTGLGTVTTSELLSNQLSNWLSQISDEWDIGINYRPGDEISKDQVEVALSTQILNDRVSINGNVGYGGQNLEQNTTNIVGDFNVEVKLNKSGKLRVKAFNESNDKLIYENAPYTQGVGIFYREEFNTFKQLMNKFWYKISGKDSTKVTPKN